MLALSSLTAFFGGATLINAGILALTTVSLMFMCPLLASTHGKLFNLAPWLALRIIH